MNLYFNVWAKDPQTAQAFDQKIYSLGILIKQLPLQKHNYIIFNSQPIIINKPVQPVPIVVPSASTPISASPDTFSKTESVDANLNNIIMATFNSSCLNLETTMRDFAFNSSVNHKFY